MSAGRVARCGYLGVLTRLLVFLSRFAVAFTAQVAHPLGGSTAQELRAAFAYSLGHRVYFFEKAGRDSEVDLFAHVVICVLDSYVAPALCPICLSKEANVLFVITRGLF
jgi:hypothetical protein